MTLAQVSDVVFLFLLPLMLKRLGYKWTIAIGILAWAARYFFLAQSANSTAATQTMLIFAAILLHGVCYDFLFIAGQLYVDDEANERMRGAAQGLIAFILWGDWGVRRDDARGCGDAGAQTRRTGRQDRTRLGRHLDAARARGDGRARGVPALLPRTDEGGAHAMTPASYRVGMGQILVEGGRPDANLRRAIEAIRAAAEQGCRLVVLPECLDLGWTDPSARELAVPIPGPHVDLLARAAHDHRVHVAAGLVERAGNRLYNAAVLLAPTGHVLLHHRKINELDIGLDLYSVGDRLGVAETELGTLGLSICADNFCSSLAIAHVLARMAAQLILAPSAWAVVADHDNTNHDNTGERYGKRWRDSFTELARLYDVTVVGVSNVGPISGGPWRGRKCIGCSLAVGPSGVILAEAPYGEHAEAVVCVDVEVRPPVARGTDFAAALEARGYRGP